MHPEAIARKRAHAMARLQNVIDHLRQSKNVEVNDAILKTMLAPKGDAQSKEVNRLEALSLLVEQLICPLFDLKPFQPEASQPEQLTEAPTPLAAPAHVERLYRHKDDPNWIVKAVRYAPDMKDLPTPSGEFVGFEWADKQLLIRLLHEPEPKPVLFGQYIVSDPIALAGAGGVFVVDAEDFESRVELIGSPMDAEMTLLDDSHPSHPNFTGSAEEVMAAMAAYQVALDSAKSDSDTGDGGVDSPSAPQPSELADSDSSTASEESPAAPAKTAGKKKKTT